MGLAPVAVAAAWVPVRNDLPSTDVALLLVVTVAAAATLGGRSSALIASFAGVVAFDYFDTAPYGRLLIARPRDEVTAAVLLAVGLLIGALAAGRRRYQEDARKGAEDFTVLASAARLASGGEDSGIVIGALAGELTSRLDLEDCEFVAGRPDGDRPSISREAEVTGAGPGPARPELDLPVWVGDRVVAHFRLRLKPGSVPPPDRLRAAVGIAEQAGAVLAGAVPAGWPARLPPSGSRPRRLKLVR